MTRNREALTESLLLAAVLGLAGGGAASDTGGVWFSFSPAAAALGAVVGWLLAASRDPGAPRPMHGLWAVLAIALGASFLPGLRFLTGPPLFAAAGVPVLLSLRGSWCAAAARALLPACLMLYLGAAHRTQAFVGPQGDEPHYLIVAQSLILDGDLAVENDFAAGRYRTYHEAPLEPHYLVRGKGGVIYSLHAIGLSALLVPAFLAGGYGAASNFMALLCVLLVAQVRSLLRAVVPPEAAEAAAWLVAFSPPLLSYAGLIFTEVPAALCVATVLRLVVSPKRPSAASLGAAAFALAFLPWLHFRYALLSAILAAAVLLSHRRRLLWITTAAAGAFSLAAIVLYHERLYGFWNPAWVFGRHPRFALASIFEGVPGLLLDQEFGLLIYAPVLALVPLGIASLWRRERPTASTSAVLIAAALLSAGAWTMWRGGFNPPARLLVPVLPAMALGLAASLAGKWNAPRALLAGWGLWIGLTGAWRPDLMHRDRQGEAAFFRAASGAAEWTDVLPRFVLPAADRWKLSGLWLAALAVAAAWPRREPQREGAWPVAGALAGCAGFAAAASLLAAPAPGSRARDAVRVVGGPAVRLGVSSAFSRSAAANWTLAGALYEPHRAPAGLPLAERLPLPPGRYRLTLTLTPLSAPPAGDVLKVKTGCGAEDVPLAVTAESASADFTVLDGCGTASLTLAGRAPLAAALATLVRFNRSAGPAV